MSIYDYDWDDLYNKAQTFIQEYIPEAIVNKGCQTFMRGKPRVEVIFPQRGNKRMITLLTDSRKFRLLRGYNAGGSRMVKAEIIFNPDGSLN